MDDALVESCVFSGKTEGKMVEQIMGESGTDSDPATVIIHDY